MPDVKALVMRAFPREVPGGVPMFVQIGIASGPDPDAFAAAAGRVAVFEIRPPRQRGERTAATRRADTRSRRLPQA